MSTMEEYFAFAEKHPELFVNPPSGGFTIIMDEHKIREIEAYMAQKLRARGQPAEWARVGIAYRDQYVLLVRDAVRLPDGSADIHIRSVSSATEVPGVFILPVHQGHILLIRHFRHETRTWRLEIPGGFGEPGMSSEQSARRELKEEIGATITRLIPLGRVHPDTAFRAGHFDLFHAEIESYGEIDVQEGIAEVVSVSVQKFEWMIRENEITDMNVLVAYTRAKLRGLFSS